jgi:hypothetical protein
MGDFSVYDWTVKILGNSVTVESLSEDNDAVGFPQDREQNKYRRGATGNMAFFGSPERHGGLFMLKFLPDSPTAKLIEIQIARAQGTKESAGAVVDWDASAYNRRTKLRVIMRRGRPSKAPVAPNIGPEPANLTFEWMYEDMKGDWSNVVVAV